jgi:hypothetical protein
MERIPTVLELLTLRTPLSEKLGFGDAAPCVISKAHWQIRAREDNDPDT